MWAIQDKKTGEYYSNVEAIAQNKWGIITPLFEDEEECQIYIDCQLVSSSARPVEVTITEVK